MARKKKIRTGPALSMSKTIGDAGIDYTRFTIGELAEYLQMDKETMLYIIQSNTGLTDLKAEEGITAEIWTAISDFVSNKISLHARRDKIEDARTVKVIRLAREKRKQPKRKKSKKVPLFIKGDLRRVIYNGMTN